jgi:hypothetical protein
LVPRPSAGQTARIEPIETSSNGAGMADCAPIAELPGDAPVGGELRPSERPRVRDEAALITVTSSGVVRFVRQTFGLPAFFFRSNRGIAIEA